MVCPLRGEIHGIRSIRDEIILDEPIVAETVIALLRRRRMLAKHGGVDACTALGTLSFVHLIVKR
jgi:hypothetical protein